MLTNIYYLIDIDIDDGFRCSYHHCRKSDNEQEAFGNFDGIKTIKDCKSECLKNSTCGGVDWGNNRKSGKCRWWRYDKCGSIGQQDYYDTTRISCMKYDKGEYQ